MNARFPALAAAVVLAAGLVGAAPAQADWHGRGWIRPGIGWHGGGWRGPWRGGWGAGWHGGWGWRGGFYYPGPRVYYAPPPPPPPPGYYPYGY
jgi:hypothetical protein